MATTRGFVRWKTRFEETLHNVPSKFFTYGLESTDIIPVMFFGLAFVCVGSAHSVEALIMTVLWPLSDPGDCILSLLQRV